ncbi:molybdopterin-dependent oxidoreductase [Nakamurella endophytica]|uniref:Oxidoreductase molybdopterin-binding domain-containing protein n=1 Tax=Nakamurella endophytica TaxID=1748367 RepID=A0A917WJ41_9ACTN|nr:molybdopterin-dependent oxidoreductase [Nakamurella endophytica]GGM08858.1 hypothetical protein GCM10011594_30930 [Nakamurella endophytica]
MTTVHTRPGTPAAGRPLGRWAAALGGVVAVALAFAVAELLAALGQWTGWLHVPSSPLDSLGSGFIRLTPEWLKSLAVQLFGTHDKDALRTGMVVVIVAVAAGLGVWARRSRTAAAVAVGVLVAVTLVAVWVRAGATALDGLPVLVGAAVGLVVLWRLFAGVARPAAAGSAPSPADPDRAVAAVADAPIPPVGTVRPVGPAAVPAGPLPVQRRGFLRMTGWAAGAAALAGIVARWVPSAAKVQESRAATTLPAPVSRQVIPRSTDIDVNGATPYLVPNPDFYRIDTALALPQVTTAEWSLRIHGMVDRPLTIGWNDLLARPLIERAVTLTCVSNEVGGDLAGNARWLGARLDALLAEAGPQSGADCVLSTSKDGWTASTPLDVLTDGRDAILAVAMNGEPLPVEHGFPVRMVVPGLYGYVSATKWVVDLEVTRFADVTAYWTERGWSDHGPVKTASRIDVPKHKAQYDAGHRVVFAGTAWAQHRGIRAVEVRIDDGPWMAAELADAVSADTWRQWRFAWTAVEGTHQLHCRATDGTGAVQTGTETPVVPDGATGWDAITFDVV